MATPQPDLAFLQNLYQQDTLYLVPEENLLASQPLPQTAAIAEDKPVQKDNKPTLEESESETAPEITQKPTAETAPAPTAPPALAPDIVWLGEALQGTYLLFDVPEAEFGTLPQHQFLAKVLKAVGLAPLEVKFGNLSVSKTHNIKQIAQAVGARHILLFGDELPVENLVKLEPYRMYKLEETRFVRVDSLAAIEQSTDLKAKLWDVLQKIFLQ